MGLFLNFIGFANSYIPYSLKRELKLAHGVPDIETTLVNMRRNGFAPKTAIDVGAYAGDWTRMCKGVFPNVKILMIEPLSTKSDCLYRTISDFPDVELETVLVGPYNRSNVGFYLKETASSVLPEAAVKEQTSTFLPMKTLNDVTRGTKFEHPDFIKLDIQGYELEALKAADKLLPSVEALLIEVNLIPIYEGAPLIDQVIGFLASKSFHLYDVCGLMRRPYDKALWQMDLMFLKSSSSLLSCLRWA